MQIINYTAQLPNTSRPDQATITNMPAHQDAHRQTLSYRKNTRTAGTIAVWAPSSSLPGISAPEKALTNAAKEPRHGSKTRLPQHLMSYAGTKENSAANITNHTAEKPFGFGDLVDMVNPLHHLPLIGHIYREVSGDDITPISRIIGGAVYGGGAGAGTALVNVIVEHDTGHDVAGNIVKFAAAPLQKEYDKEPDNKYPELPPQLLRFAAQPNASGSDQTPDHPIPEKKNSGWTSFTLNG